VLLPLVLLLLFNYSIQLFCLFVVDVDENKVHCKSYLSCITYLVSNMACFPRLLCFQCSVLVFDISTHLLGSVTQFGTMFRRLCVIFKNI
jgi:hypothetical protein